MTFALPLSNLDRLEAESIHILREVETVRLRSALTADRALASARSRSEGWSFLVRPGRPRLEAWGAKP